jgi:tetratricopeptide (TPR) repeat protein
LSFNYDLALEKLSVAIELNKTEPQFYNYKALALYMSGQYEQCLGLFMQALKLYDSKGVHNSEVG